MEDLLGDQTISIDETDREEASRPQAVGAARGTLFLVVGPSGAGKDSLLLAAKEALGRSKDYTFPQRRITRPQGAGGEDHLAIDDEAFDRLADTGAFALHWQAHGLSYGVPIDIEDDLAAGRHVVVNVSRSVLDLARERLSPVRVLSITVSRDVLRARLLARGRESAADMEERVARADAFTVAGDDVIDLRNDADLASAEAAFVEALTTRVVQAKA
ncbi:MAG: phosphonate metabolism protein/1,5-bisphosphokinase (PRPP-forming) PhnN [Magnetovibrionaceae bacterium]